jgi:Ring finger domain
MQIVPEPIQIEDEEEKKEDSQMDEHGMTECHICRENYDEKVRRPLIGKCGHTLCRECAANIICTSNKCPYCKALNFPSDVDDMKVNMFVMKAL